VDELRHYAEDEGNSAEEMTKIREPEEELKFMADGLIILKQSSPYYKKRGCSIRKTFFYPFS